MPAKAVSRLTENDDFTVIWAAPILPGKGEAWRRFMQELTGNRHQDFNNMCLRLEILAMRSWITETTRGDVGVLAVIARQPQQIMGRLAASNQPFDGWLRGQLADLQGVDISLPPVTPPSELLLDWAETTVEEGGQDKKKTKT
jgi:hypothetical protein